MAKILGGQLLSAREGAYFKSEQESDLHYYLRKRVKSGELVIPEEAKAALLEGRRMGEQKVITDGLGTRELEMAEVGMEILQQSARVQADHARLRREFTRRVKAVMPRAKESDIRRVYERTRDMNVGMPAGPLSLRMRRDMLKDIDAMPRQFKEISPEASDAMRRQFMAGVRAITYGSLIGIVSVAGAVTWCAYRFDVSDAASLQDLVRQQIKPWAAQVSVRARDTFAPLKTYLSDVKGGGGVGAGAAGAAGGGASEAQGKGIAMGDKAEWQIKLKGDISRIVKRGFGGG